MSTLLISVKILDILIKIINEICLSIQYEAMFVAVQPEITTVRDKPVHNHRQNDEGKKRKKANKQRDRQKVRNLEEGTKRMIN